MGFHRVSFSVGTPPFRAAGSDFIWEGCNPFRIRTAHRETLYVSSRVLKHLIISFGRKSVFLFLHF
ncbi:hypothetical protein DRA67_00270 [Neisseria meningitidis]|nr:hypothetical protein DRA65_00275 [Neisseria meningitidis]QPH64065.1 hypothetical protein DRA66_00275 [Neisseria meningitidis]QPH66161.1 hypothetical protein DRA67_00270 [Neisseria meningitidis]QPH68369.1 hypothetical protein DRA68_00275 [Neisseria meningitidis]QPH70553.1 hypothetical protein DRA71_00275 [Neisseria meningitidis]